MKLSDCDLQKWGHLVAQTPSELGEFKRWLEGPLRDFYPYEGLVLTHGEFVAGEIRVTHMLSCGHEERYLTQLETRFDLLRRGCLSRWFLTREPLLIDATSPNKFASPFEIAEMHSFGFRSVSGHGVLNMRGNAGTYFGFANVRMPLDGWHFIALRLIAPYLNAILLRTLCAAPGRELGAFDDLTPRQRDIVRQLSTGLSDRSIASCLGLSEKTVRNQLTVVYEHLGVHNRTELMALLK